jgi:hypothetical protein
VLDGQDISDMRDELAMNVLCYTLSQVASHDFEKTVDGGKAKTNMDTWCNDPNKATRFATLLLNDDIKGQADWKSTLSISNRNYLREQLQLALTSPPYLRTLPDLLRGNPTFGGMMLYVLGLIDVEIANAVKQKWQQTLGSAIQPLNVKDLMPPLQSHYDAGQPFLDEVCFVSLC